MTELEVDQSNLPKVQEVCQCFAVLEDGALAHNLQEQEIEQYYSSNVQRSQLVQNDIRIARRLQDEEEQIATVLQRQASSRLEQQDSEYARLIQEEIQRCAEEARRREQEDEEIAKRIQEEEELLVRQRCRSRTTDNGENYSAPAPPYPSYSAPVLLSGEEGEEEQYLFPPARRWQHSSSPSNSDFEEDLREHCRPVHRVTRDQVYRNYRTAEDQRGPLTRVRTSSASDNRSCTSQSSRVPQLSGGWADALQLIKNDLSKQGYLSGSSEDEMLFEPVCRLEEILNQYRNSSTETSHRGKGTRHSSVRESVGRTWQGDRASRTDSYRSSDYKDNSSVKYEPRRVRRYNSSCSDYRPSRVGSWSFRDSREKRVHFQDERSRFSGYNGDSQRALEGRPNGFREQREAEDFHNSIESQSLGRQDSRRITQLSRDSPLRRSYHGDVRVVRRTSQCANSRDFSHGDRRHGNGRRAYESQSIQESSVAEFTEENSSGGLRERGRGEGGNHRFSRNHRQRVQSLGEYCREEEEGDSRRYHGGRRTRPSLSERREEYEEERTSTDEEEEEERERRRRREERRPRRLQRSRSLSCRGRSSRAGALLSREDASLHLRELQQVLQDEELARTLQEEENKLLRGNPQSSRLLRRQYPEGDFRAAQVAQDEEIARFIQKQEIRTQRRSREFDGVGPGQNRDMPDVNDRRVTHERQVQRERLDSEGLPSPTEDCSPDHQPPSPISMAAQPVRNIAEELDPTFQRKESTRAEHTISETCQPQAAPQVGLYDQTEEPAFVPPTKRQSEKGGRGKSKEKKESVRQRENCKQQ